jgi:16S rRNA (adenine1518-N6/adenine1519-N6)-dimethyltransferase
MSLAKQAATVITFEIDRKLASGLSDLLPSDRHIEVIASDFLKFDLRELQKKYPKVKVVSNLPFHVSTEVMFKLFEHRKWIETMTLMFQKEVAERIVSKPGRKEYGILSALGQLYSDPKIVLFLSPDKFYPPPEVSAAFVYFQIKRELVMDERHESLFIDCVKSALGQRRKVLFNSLRKMASLEALKEAERRCGIDFRRRAETLSVGEFKKVAESIYSCQSH